MVIVATWIVVGFFSAVGWGVAQKTVVEPYINPAFDKAEVQPINTNTTNKDNKQIQHKERHMTGLRTINLPQERIIQLRLKDDSVIEFKFSPIDATGNRLWQMFATTEALDTVEQLIKSADVVTDVTETKSARKSAPAKKK